MMSFESPLFLLLLFILPVIIWFGWPSNGSSYRRESLSLIFRVLMCICLIFSLAGFTINKTNDDLAVVFLLDVSDSISTTTQKANLGMVRQSMQSMKNADQAAVVVFGRNAILERPMSNKKEMSDLTSRPETDQTNITEAIRLGISLYPSNSARRMVILSDWNNTTGDALAAAKLATESGIQLWSISGEETTASEALINWMETPRHIYEGDRFDLKISLYSNQNNQANLRILSNDTIVFNRPVRLQKGLQSYIIPLNADQAGFTRFTAQLEPQADHFYQNNTYTEYSQISGIPKVLVVDLPTGWAGNSTKEPRQQEAAALVEALQSVKLNVVKSEPANIPTNLSELSSYAAVVLVDIPTNQFTQQQMLTLQNYVRYVGGGLVVLGGPTSFGPGGYYGTPLEEILPVKTVMKGQEQTTGNTIIFIIDRSGSMAKTSGSTAKLDLAKATINYSLENLEPTDRVGVVAFDENPSWVVPITDLSNKENIQNAVKNLNSGGGTNLYGSVKSLQGLFSNETAKEKQAILLTDGAADSNGLSDLVKQLNDENGITLTTVGLGNDAGTYLQNLAEVGKGQYFLSIETGKIPEIFTQDVTNKKNDYISEHVFTPVVKSSSSILTGIETSSIPALSGYVVTTIKNGAENILVSDKDEPVLSTWQYGMGRSLVFTSDATNRWAQEWIKWGSFKDFWTQTIRFTIQDDSSALLDLRMNQDGSLTQLKIDAKSENGKYLNGYQMQTWISGPDQKGQAVVPSQSAPGQYTGEFKSNQEGVYLIRVAGTNPQDATQPGVNGTFGWVVPYSSEYKTREADTSNLKNIEAITGQETKSLELDPARIFVHDIKGGQVSYPTWPWLVGLAVILLPLDIAARRLLIRIKDIQENLRHIRKRWLGTPTKQARHIHSIPLSSVIQIKKQAENRYQVLMGVISKASQNPQVIKVEATQKRNSDRNENKGTPSNSHQDDRGILSGSGRSYISDYIKAKRKKE